MGWLVVEDLVMVLVLVLLPPLAGVLGGSSAAGGGAVEGSLWTALGTLAKVAAFIALMLVVGRRVLPKGAVVGGRGGLARAVFPVCDCRRAGRGVWLGQAV